MLTRALDYVTNPDGYTSSLNKRELFALNLAAAILSGGKVPSAGVNRAAVILADDLINALNEEPGLVTSADLEVLEETPKPTFGKK